MQSVSDRFNQLAQGYVRPITWRFDASFDKVLDPSITFFTLDTSLLDGIDLLAPTDSNILTEWNKYLYTDYSDRVISMEWVAEFDFFYSITASIADVTLNNYDDLFTRNSSSPLSDYMLPRRPIRLQAGFGTENIPQFVGLTEKAPVVDRISKTATVHAMDFLSYLFTRRLDQSVMYLNKRVDEILTDLFVSFGVPDEQLIFDKARTTVPYAYFTKDQTLEGAVRDLMIAEMGSLYMNEEGFIVFINRFRRSSTSVYSFDNENVISYDNSDEAKIINSISVGIERREVQPQQLIFNLASPFLLNAGAVVEKFFQFADPVTSVEDITSYIANSNIDGSGTDLTSDIVITDIDVFTDTVKVTIENTGGSNAYITSLTIDGTPVKTISSPTLIEKDQDSIDAYEEQTLDVKSPYIQDEDTATSIALTTIRHFKDYGNTITFMAKGNMALQTFDVISLNIDDISDDFIIRKIENSIDKTYSQRITAQKYEIPQYFILDESILDGEDVLAI